MMHRRRMARKPDWFYHPSDDDLSKLADQYRPVSAAEKAERSRRGRQAKRRGNVNEHRSIKILESAGYKCTRAAGSLGEWDIIGISSADVVVVQVKTRDWPGSVEMEQLQQFACPANLRKIVHRWRDRQRLPDVKEL